MTFEIISWQDLYIQSPDIICLVCPRVKWKDKIKYIKVYLKNEWQQFPRNNSSRKMSVN